MPVAIERMHDPDLNLVTYSGALTWGDLVDVARAIDAGRIALNCDIVNYFAPDAGLGRMSADEMIEFSDAVADAARDRPPRARARAATICRDAQLAPLLELWTIYCQRKPDHPYSERLFPTLADAAEWLELTPAELARMEARVAPAG